MNQIHPTAIISEGVRLGTGNVIGPHVVITGPAEIGDDNWFGTGLVIGAPPEVRSWPHPDTPGAVAGNGVRIGDRNVIREYAQVHQGWQSQTVIGDDAFIMNQSYVAHDCRLGNGVTLASSVLLAGHVVLGDGANLGLGTAVHQRRFVGAGAMVGMGSVVTRDLPPFAKAYGSPARVVSANSVGMTRTGLPERSVAALTELYEAAGAEADLEELLVDAELRVTLEAWISRHPTGGS